MAWDDVTQSQGYFKTILLMALIGFVPVLNFVCAGYAWNWARQIAFGQREQLPGTIVTNENFKTGAFAFLIGLITIIVAGVESSIIVWLFASIGNNYGIVVIGSLIAAVLTVFVGMFGSLATGRMAVFGNLGQGFSVGEVMSAYKLRLGTLFCVTYVPTIIAGLIVSVIQFVIGLLMGLVVGSSMVGMVGAYGGSYANASHALAYALSSGGVAVVVLSLVSAYASFVSAMFANLVCTRGIVYYIARFAPTWSSQAAAESQAYQSLGMGQQVPNAVPYAMPNAAPYVPPQPHFDPHTGQPLDGQGTVSAGGQVEGGGFAATPQGATQQSARPQAPASKADQNAAYGIDTSVLQQVPQHSQVRTDVPDYNYDTVVGLHQEATPLAWSPSGNGSQSGQGRAPMPSDADTAVLGAGQAAVETALRVTRSNGQSCVLSAFPMTIGKGSEADLVIEGNPAISRVHVRLLKEGDTFAVEDLDSTNKTKIGSYELPPHVPTILSNGDELKLANEVLRIEIR